MNTIFWVPKNSNTSDCYTLLLSLTEKTNLKRSDKYVGLSNLSISYTWKNIKESHKSNNFKISAPTSNEEFALPDWSYSISDIQKYFEYILEKHCEKKTDNPDKE